MQGTSSEVSFGQLEMALSEPGTQLRLFGKPELDGQRRMGVGLALGEDVEDARSRARRVVEQVRIEL